MRALISWVLGLIGIQKSKILNVAFLISYQEHFQPDKYCLSRISTSRIIISKNIKFNLLAFPAYFLFLISAFKTYASLKRFLLSAQDNCYIILSSYVEGHVKKNQV